MPPTYNDPAHGITKSQNEHSNENTPRWLIKYITNDKLKHTLDATNGNIIRQGPEFPDDPYFCGPVLFAARDVIQFHDCNMIRSKQMDKQVVSIIVLATNSSDLVSFASMIAQ